MRNVINYRKQAYVKKAMFVYLGTAALKKGYGMCFDLDHVTTETGETAVDAYGARGMKVVQKPVAANRNAFAGVLTQNYAARQNAGYQIVELAIPGGCAMIAQKVASTINTGLVTCTLGIGTAANGSSINGVFGHGGFRGRGSAIPLQTITPAAAGKIADQELTGVGTGVYASATGLTTITGAAGTPGTDLGYVDTAIDASDYEAIVWGGADAATGASERCPSGIYPVYQATGATTYTVVGDTGDGAMTINLVKKGFLTLAYLCDGRESGLCDIYIPSTDNSTTYISGVSGMSIVLGGIAIADDDQSDVADGTMDGQRKGFYLLGSIGTDEMLWDITSGFTLSGTGVAGTTLGTIKMDTAGEWATMEWHQFGPATSGAWQLTGISDTGVVIA